MQRISFGSSSPTKENAQSFQQSPIKRAKAGSVL